MNTLAKITVADYMSNKLISIPEDTDVLDAIKKLLINRIPNAPVVDNQGSLVGMFSEKDAMKVAEDVAYNQGMAGKVSEYMSAQVDKIDADASILDAAKMLLDSRVRCFPVYRDTDLVGIISRSDVLRALSSIR
jgi:CBS domain-containing protein